MPTNSRCFVTVNCNRTTAIGDTIQPTRAIDISPLSVAFRLRHQPECVLSLPSSISPYALSSLPCTRAGAPAYISSQRLVSGLLSPSHSSTQTVGRSWPCEGNNCHILGAVAGASFFAGAAGAQESENAPFPAPLFPHLSRDTPKAPMLTPTPAGPSGPNCGVRVRASRGACVLSGNSLRKNGSLRPRDRQTNKAVSQ